MEKVVEKFGTGRANYSPIWKIVQMFFDGEEYMVYSSTQKVPQMWNGDDGEIHSSKFMATNRSLENEMLQSWR